MLKIFLKQGQKNYLTHKLNYMIKLRLKKNAKKIDNFLIKFLKKQKKSLLVTPMKYGVIAGGKK